MGFSNFSIYQTREGRERTLSVAGVRLFTGEGKVGRVMTLFLCSCVEKLDEYSVMLKTVKILPLGTEDRLTTANTSSTDCHLYWNNVIQVDS